MNNFTKTIHLIFNIIVVLVVAGSLLSLLTNVDNRYLKMLDFPRIQFFIAAIFSFILMVFFTKKTTTFTYLLAILVLVSIGIQASYLVNYTPLVKTEVPDALNEENKFSVLIANVKMDNKEYQPMLDLVEKMSPDMVLVLEVTDLWEEQLRVIKNEYPHTQEAVNNLGYGMSLYSKYPLAGMSVNYLNNEDVPSFSATIKLVSGKEIRVHTMHPPPPLYYKDLPDNAGQEEKAMLKIGDKVLKSDLPSIVMGDFNDVAWSKTNNMTKAKGELRDVRVGRGFYNSYDVGNIFMRWPLDHIFLTKEFSLVKLERMPDIGSDHFPIYAEVVL